MRKAHLAHLFLQISSRFFPSTRPSNFPRITHFPQMTDNGGGLVPLSPCPPPTYMQLMLNLEAVEKKLDQSELDAK